VQCPKIKNIKFGSKSQSAIKEIRRVKKMSKALLKAMSGGVFVNIFVGNGAMKSSYNIQANDWKTWSQAMNAVPSIYHKRIYNIAALQMLDHSFGQEKQFWRAVADGCNF